MTWGGYTQHAWTDQRPIFFCPTLGGARATILKGMCERRVLSPDGAGFYSVPKPRSFTRNVTQLVTYTRLDKANVGVRWWSAGGAVIEVK